MRWLRRWCCTDGQGAEYDAESSAGGMTVGAVGALGARRNRRSENDRSGDFVRRAKKKSKIWQQVTARAHGSRNPPVLPANGARLVSRYVMSCDRACLSV